jgi:hypothetical protein
MKYSLPWKILPKKKVSPSEEGIEKQPTRSYLIKTKTISPNSIDP